MAIKSKLIISGISYNDYLDLNVKNTVTDLNQTSSFKSIMDSPYGRHAGEFRIGQNIKVFAGTGEIDDMFRQYRFEESGTNIQDEFSYENAEISGTAFLSSGGFFVSGIGFVGSTTVGLLKPDRVINTNTTNGFDNAGDFSVALWANIREEASGGAFYERLTGSTDTGAPYFYLNTVGSFVFAVKKADDITYSGAFARTGNMTGSWTHLVTTFNSSLGSIFVYQNGSLIGSARADTGSLTYQAGSMHIGFVSGTTLRHASGTFDDFRIYKKALDLGQVKSIYGNGSGALDFKLFEGIIEDMRHRGEANNEVIELGGTDYSYELRDLTVEPIVYTNYEVGSIVRDIVTPKNGIVNISTNHVSGTLTTLARKTYNHVPIMDAVNDAADISGYISFVDKFKDLHFEPRQNKSQDFNVGSENIIDIQYDITKEGMANRIWVYGDRTLTNTLERYNANGGSVFTLNYKPSNTEVSYLGSVQKGGVFNIVSTATSGPDYLVNYEDRQLIFISGTEIGYSSIPVSGGSIVVTYARTIPIVTYGQSDSSINLFGPKNLVINDKSIKDPITARNIVIQKIEDADPYNRFEILMNGWEDFKLGNVVSVQVNDFSVNTSGASILGVEYDFNNESVQSENIITLSLSKKIPDITDYYKSLSKRIVALENSDFQESDVLTRIFAENEIMTVVGSRWNVYTRGLGSSFILGKGYHGITGATFGGILGSIIASGINFLGDSRSGLYLAFSGGNNYELTGSYNTGGGIGTGYRQIFN